VLEHVGRQLRPAAALVQVFQPGQLLLGRRGAEVDPACLQVLRRERIGPDGGGHAQVGAERAGAVGELADPQLG